MEELISRLVEKLGIDGATAERVVGAVLQLFQQHGAEDKASAFMAAVPGAQDLVGRMSDDDGAEAAADAGGAGISGMVAGAVGALAGGGSAVSDAINRLQAEGLDMGQARTAGVEVVAFAREKAGDSVVDELLDSIPGLKGML